MSGPSWTVDRRRTLRRRLGAAFILATALLVALSAVIAVAVASFVSAGDKITDRWQPTDLTAQRVLADLVNQETGLRGYALTRADRFLEPYLQYRRAEVADTRRLRTLTSGDTRLGRLTEDLVAAAARWQRTVAAPLISRVNRGTALTPLELDAGKLAFDGIRLRSTQLSGALAARSKDAQRVRTRDGVFAAAAIGFAAVVVALSGYLIWRGLHRWVLGPVERLRTQTREVASGATYRQIVADGPVELTDLGGDVEAMRLQIAGQLLRAEVAQDELRKRGAELARSNEDLQQFAYVASHDLSEPLRKVANFCLLLERQYGDQLDDRARQYIDFAVDGAKRMQVLITDLLSLSRVGRTTEAFVDVDLGSALERALANLSEPVGAAGARIECPQPLPTVRGDRALLTSLLENLVGNAVKYRHPDVATVVRVSAEPGDGASWNISVSDNGIGIDQQYAERIFAVFQRLHLRDEYDGTGIGLALCRKIVEFHGGRIWLADTGPADGSTFCFTLPGRGALTDAQS